MLKKDSPWINTGLGIYSENEESVVVLKFIYCHCKWDNIRNCLCWNFIGSIWLQGIIIIRILICGMKTMSSTFFPLRIWYWITCFSILLTCNLVPLYNPFDWSIFLNSITCTSTFKSSLWGGSSKQLISFNIFMKKFLTHILYFLLNTNWIKTQKCYFLSCNPTHHVVVYFWYNIRGRTQNAFLLEVFWVFCIRIFCLLKFKRRKWIM